MSQFSDLAVLTFTGFNAIRIAGYLPQIIRLWADTTGASAVSITTWTVFALSHLSTVAYALAVISDPYMAAVFALNALCCILIAGLAKSRRRSFERAGGEATRVASTAA